MTSKPFMLLSLPNTGSDWAAKMICDQNSNIRYFREFFNPITNKYYLENLIKQFGCELSSSAANIARAIPWEDYKKVLSETWNKGKYNFTKENYSAFNIHNHRRMFNCFVLYRDLERSLPCKKEDKAAQVESWYDAIYYSLSLNKDNLEPDVKELVEFSLQNADTFNKRQASAFLILYYQTLKEAKKYNLPIINYDVLIRGNEEEIRKELKLLRLITNMDAIVQNIMSSRFEREKSSDNLGCNFHISEMRKLINKLSTESELSV